MFFELSLCFYIFWSLKQFKVEFQSVVIRGSLFCRFQGGPKQRVYSHMMILSEYDFWVVCCSIHAKLSIQKLFLRITPPSLQFVEYSKICMLVPYNNQSEEKNQQHRIQKLHQDKLPILTFTKTTTLMWTTARYQSGSTMLMYFICRATNFVNMNHNVNTIRDQTVSFSICRILLLKTKAKIVSIYQMKWSVSRLVLSM